MIFRKKGEKNVKSIQCLIEDACEVLALSRDLMGWGGGGVNTYKYWCGGACTQGGLAHTPLARVRVSWTYCIYTYQT